jgi:hypothetical protein
MISFDGVLRDLAGPAAELELYAACPYQFGALRDLAVRPEPRVVIETYVDVLGEESTRVSLPIGEALLLGRRIAQLVDAVSIRRP